VLLNKPQNKSISITTKMIYGAEQPPVTGYYNVNTCFLNMQHHFSGMFYAQKQQKNIWVIMGSWMLHL
jgi:hypothetical protein